MLAASLRQDSCNKKLIAVSAQIAKEEGITVNLAEFSDVVSIPYNQDQQTEAGIPTNISLFVEALQASDGLVLASPEYNYSIPGNLKNSIDWISRITPLPWKNYPVFLMSASPSLVGGNRGLWSTRVPLEGCGGFVFPDMFSLPCADSAFDDENQLKDQQTVKRLTQTIRDFIAYVALLKNRR